MADAVEQTPVEAQAHAAWQRGTVRRLGVVENAVGGAREVACGVEVCAGLHGDRRPGLATEAGTDRGGAGGHGLVKLERVEPAGVDRGVEQCVVGIYEHADAGHGGGHLSGKAGGAVEGEVAGRGREEHEADVARTACEGGAERVGGRQAADFGQDGHRPAIPR